MIIISDVYGVDITQVNISPRFRRGQFQTDNVKTVSNSVCSAVQVKLLLFGIKNEMLIHYKD